ncbi:CAP domain-containing protein [Tabrizicola sp.]|uniref:CAP domain-containing protein n=1 Tax=Tabrizicola sp. TaxID=2005166 RepID=UPI002625B8F1|nr:CAP domain-containing protein [Tabrizicola sp.]MDM7932688.1 CAP domain-containing protein [Tabrizicola sp.]
MSRSMPKPSWLKPLAVVLAGMFGYDPAAPALANATDVILEASSASAASPSAMVTAKEVLGILNAARAKAGCGPLKINSKLMSAAKTHATNMAQKDFFGHANKDGSKFSNRVKRQGYKYRMVAENIAAGQATARQVANDWLGSAGHRRNILNCKLKDTGVAVAYQASDKPMMGNSKPFYYYWVQVFASP